MATLTFPSRAPHNTSYFDGLRNTLVAMFQGVQEGLVMADRYHALSRMSDEQLAKRGLARSEITRAVALGRARV